MIELIFLATPNDRGHTIEIRYQEKNELTGLKDDVTESMSDGKQACDRFLELIENR